jgi:hypothetical protein
MLATLRRIGIATEKPQHGLIFSGRRGLARRALVVQGVAAAKIAPTLEEGPCRTNEKSSTRVVLLLLT